MIQPNEAADIVRNSIHEVVITNEKYSADKPLGVFNIIADDVLNAFKLEVRGDECGVKKYHHKLTAEALSSVTSDTLAGEIEDIITEKAVEDSQRTFRAKFGRTFDEVKKASERKFKLAIKWSVE